jgi:hypothetical protein
MSTDRVCFENETYESANEAVLFCKMYLEEKDQADAAIYLEGLDPICDQRTGRVARSCLVAAQQRTNDDQAMHVVTLALNAVDRALRTPVLLAAS